MSQIIIDFLFSTNNMHKLILLFGSSLLLFSACSTTKSGLNKSSLKLFYGVWKVASFEFADGRKMPGVFMGNPQYEFSEDGKRTKTLNTVPAPPPEIVEYVIDGDSIRYPNKPKFPAMKIELVSADSLVLSNAKLSWYLHK